MTKLLAVAGGGMIGSTVRYLSYRMIGKVFSGPVAISTLAVNLVGCLLVGFLWGIFEEVNIAVTWRTFIFIGLFGGFTTFSTFGIEVLSMIRAGDFKFAIITILLTNIVGLSLVFVGFIASRMFVNS